jgi:cell wall-associated NlpC family hydrolase
MTVMPRRLFMLLAVVAATLTLPGSTAGGASPDASVREIAVAWAIAQNGLRERGKTNCGPQIDRWERQMGLSVPPCRVWCGAFVHQAYRQAGVQLSARLIDPHRSYFDALAGRRGLRSIPVSQIQRGDLVFYKFRPGLKASHLALARARPSGGRLETVEGNVSHAVSLEKRSVKSIVLAARVTGDARG